MAIKAGSLHVLLRPVGLPAGGEAAEQDELRVLFALVYVMFMLFVIIYRYY